jgi:hypothetical protein
MRFSTSEIVSLGIAGIAFIGSIGSAYYTYTNRNRELDIELIKIGVSILRADPKETQTDGAREWAIQIIEDFSKRRFSPDAKRELLQYKLGYAGYTGYSFSPGYDCTFTPAGALIGCKETSGPSPLPKRQTPPQSKESTTGR